jgi:hypothetical protein
MLQKRTVSCPNQQRGPRGRTLAADDSPYKPAETVAYRRLAVAVQRRFAVGALLQRPTEAELVALPRVAAEPRTGNSLVAYAAAWMVVVVVVADCDAVAEGARDVVVVAATVPVRRRWEGTNLPSRPSSPTTRLPFVRVSRQWRYRDQKKAEIVEHLLESRASTRT